MHWSLAQCAASGRAGGIKLSSAKKTGVASQDSHHGSYQCVLGSFSTGLPLLQCLCLNPLLFAIGLSTSSSILPILPRWWHHVSSQIFDGFFLSRCFPSHYESVYLFCSLTGFPWQTLRLVFFLAAYISTLKSGPRFLLVDFPGSLCCLGTSPCLDLSRRCAFWSCFCFRPRTSTSTSLMIFKQISCKMESNPASQPLVRPWLATLNLHLCMLHICPTLRNRLFWDCPWRIGLVNGQ